MAKRKSKLTTNKAKIYIFPLALCLFSLKLALAAPATQCGFFGCPVKAEVAAILVASDCNCDSAETRAPAGGLDLTIPFILSPRSTRLLNDKPTLRWNAVSGAARYAVRVEDDQGEIWWQTETTANEIVYAGKPLQPGIDYSAIVSTEKGASSEAEKLPDMGVRLLDADDAHQVRSIADVLAKQNLTDEAAALALAHVYLRYGLRAEAIDRLEGAVAKGSQNAVIYHLLGDIYDRVALNRLAESRYLEAVKLAQASNDSQMLAASQRQLGEVYATRGNRPEAIRWLTLALNAYKSLGNALRVRELEERLQELNQ